MISQNEGTTAEPAWTFPKERALLHVLIVFTLIAFYLCYKIAQPFFPVLAWAFALAVIFRTVHRKIEAKIREPNIAAGISVVIVAFTIIGPAMFVGRSILNEFGKTAEFGTQQIQSGEWRKKLDAYPRLSPVVNWIEKNVDLQGSLETFTGKAATAITPIVKNSLWTGMQFLLVLFTLFFFLRDRRIAVRSVRSLLPLSAPEADEVSKRIADTVYATIYGKLTVSIVQGALGGLMFWWLGLPVPILWGAVMAVAGLVPVLGAFVVWLPAAIFLFLVGSIAKSLILCFWGVCVVGLVDNILYPYLVGKRIQLHPLYIFFSVLGGLAVFGGAGIILGPLVVAVTDALLDVWRRRTSGGRLAEDPLSRKEVQEIQSSRALSLGGPEPVDPSR